MRLPIAAAIVALALANRAAPALAQTAAPAFACQPWQANLGGVGRASVVAFTGAVFGDRVCATVANLALDGIAVKLADAVPADALVVAPLGSGTGAALLLAGDALSLIPANAAQPGGTWSAPVGPFLIAPGGQIAVFGGDETAPRIVLAYAGQRLLVIGTSPVTLADLSRALRDQPDLFGADAVERAVVLATGAGASLGLRAENGPFGVPGQAVHYLIFVKRA